MKSEFLMLPNLVTLSRLALLPVLWWLAIEGKAFEVAIGIAIALLSDIVDGQLARRLKLTSELGSKLDSIADNLFVPSAIIWLLILRPQIIDGINGIIFVSVICFYMLFIVVGLVKFRQFGNLHLYSAKISAVIGTMFLFHALVFQFDRRFFYITAVAETIANCEGILVFLTRSEVDEHIGTIFRRQIH